MAISLGDMNVKVVVVEYHKRTFLAATGALSTKTYLQNIT